MADPRIQYPGPGCVVECMMGNRAVQHWVLETVGDSVRLVNAARRESKVPVSRLLPWSGPSYGADRSRQEISEILERHRSLRESLAAELNMDELWEMAQGEVSRASALWFAELAWENPDVDKVAAMGHALLEAKELFKFAPPDFEIFDAVEVERRRVEGEKRRQREEMASAGSAFFRLLWEKHRNRQRGVTDRELPPAEVAENLRSLLLRQLADPDAHDPDGTWKLLTKGLPEEAHLALHLAVAWGLVPAHHNFWLDRAGFNPAPDWSTPYRDEKASLRAAWQAAAVQEANDSPSCLVSIDAATTRDVDDAVHVVPLPDGGYQATLAFACPALFWPFGGELDREVLRRGSSLYLPEGDLHMLPEDIGLDLFSLAAGEMRPALVVDATIDAAGALLAAAPRVEWVRVADNLCFDAVEDVLTDQPGKGPEADKAARHADMLRSALKLAEILRDRRIAQGAVITDRPDPQVTASFSPDGEATVKIDLPPPAPTAHLLVSEMMILANGALAGWAVEKGLPLFFRTQDVALPKEYAGIWSRPEDIARVVKHLPPASLEAQPRVHAGLGLAQYAPVTSPLRRYADLVNEAQIVHYLATGEARLDQAGLESLLTLVSAHLDATGQVQRFRPRYWKLEYFRQAGEKVWWDGVITEENDAFATVSLPFAQIFLRARRRLLDEKLYVGQAVRIRIGKVRPLANEIQILEVAEAS